MVELYKKYNFVIQFIIYLFLMILISNSFVHKTFLKDILSLVTLSAFFLLIGQMYIDKPNRISLPIHKWIGYIFIPVLLLHPFFIVLPRFFEAGMDPAKAFILMITSFNSFGIIAGIIAWSLMLILGLMSLFKNKLGLRHKTWKITHGLLSILFLFFALWHTEDLGKHITLSTAVSMSVLVMIASFLLLKKYTQQTLTQKGVDYYGKK